MARTFILGLILLLGLPLPIIAGQITDIKVGKKAQDEIEIVIEGSYGGYQGVSRRSPAQFVIDIEGAVLKEGVQSSIDIDGPIVSAIKTVNRANGVRVVLVSAESQRLFHCTMNEKKEQIVVKCWMPKEAQAITAVDVNAPEPTLDENSTVALPQKELSEIFSWPTQEKSEEGEKGEKKLAKYTGQKITMDFYKTELHNVFRLFAEMSGKNIIIDDQVQGDLTLALKEVPWDEAMDLVLDLKELVKEEKLGTTIIKPKPEKASTGKGELVFKKFSEDILQPARLIKREKENRQKAMDILIEAHNLEKLDKKKEALKKYEEAYSLWRDNFDLIMKTAYLHYLSGHFAKSYFFAGRALQLNPKNSEAALYAAISASKMGKSGDARQLFELAVNSKPQIPQAFFNYGLFLKKQKDYVGALNVYEQHEMIFGPSLDVRLEVAGLYELQEETVKACKKYKEILKSGFKMDNKSISIVQNRIRTLCN